MTVGGTWDPDDQMVLEAVGITVHGPLPLGDIGLRLAPGVDVIYGRNGAGKSRLLEASGGVLGGDRRAGARYFGIIHFGQASAGSDQKREQRTEDLFRNLMLQLSLFGPTNESADETATPFDRDLRRRMRSIAQDQLHDGNEASVGQAGWTEQWVTAIAESGFVGLTSWGEGVWHVGLGVSACRLGDEQRTTLGEAIVSGGGDAARALHRHVVSLYERSLGLRQSPSRVLHEQALRWLADHDWAGFPLLPGVHQLSSPIWDVVSFGDADVNALTARTARDIRQQLQDLGVTPDDWWAAEPVRQLVDEMAKSANQTLGELLIDAPILRLQLTSPRRWLEGEPPVRWVTDDASGPTVEIRELSSAQRRWATFAVHLTLQSHSPAPTNAFRVAMIDEPEAALHPTARRHLARGLRRLSELQEAQIIVATHGPELLRPDLFRLHHVQRRMDGRADLRSLPSAFALDAAALGLDPSDMLALVRVWVLVEGRHDELVLHTVLGRQLDEVAARGLCLRGATALKTLPEARLLFDFTDARILIVVDNVDSAYVQRVWKEVHDAVADGRHETALDLLLKRLDRSVNEERFLQELAVRAVERGRLDRLEVHSLAKPDILDYLPVERLTTHSDGRTWSELRVAAAAEGFEGSGPFKEWAQRKVGLRVDDESIVHAARAAERVPADLAALARTIAGLAS